MIGRPLLLCILLLLSLCLLTTRPVVAATLPPLQLSVRLLPDRHLLEGEARLQLAAAPRRLELRLLNAAEIQSVRLGLETLSYRFAQGTLHIDLPPGSYGRPVVLTLRHRLRLPDALPPQALNDEDPSYGISAALGPAGAFLGSGTAWFPQFADGSQQLDLQLDLPGDWEAVTNGKRSDSRQDAGRHLLHWRMRLDRPGLALAAGPWEFAQSTDGPVPVYSYFSAADSALAKPYRHKAAGYLKQYGELLGPYPFPKFAIAENFFPSGYGYPSWTLLGREVIRLPFILDTSLPHEIVHNWFGNGVLVDQTGGNWSEGLTTYLADYRQREQQSPAAAADYRRKILRDYASLVAPGDAYPLRRFHFRQNAADQAIGYGKCMMVFHMLHQTLGDKAFTAGLRLLVRSYMHRPASWSDLQWAFERAAGKSLDAFFAPWLERADAPLLQLDQVTRTQTAVGWRVEGRLRQPVPGYRLEVPVRLTAGDETVNDTVTLAGDEVRFRLNCTQPPQRLEVDPDVQLFRRLYPQEIPPTVSGIRGSRHLLVVLSSRLDHATLESAQRLLPALRQEVAPITSDLELTPQELRGRDVLFIGVPRRADLLPPLPRSLTLKGRGFTLDGQAFSPPADSLFAALPHPDGPERIMALFLPGSPAAAAIVARKIPHYGRYSYLAFHNGINRIKGAWPTAASPLIHRFPPPGPRP